MFFYTLYYDIISLISLKITQVFHGFAENQIVFWDFNIRNSVQITKGLDNGDSDNQIIEVLLYLDIHMHRNVVHHTHISYHKCMIHTICVYHMHFYFFDAIWLRIQEHFKFRLWVTIWFFGLLNFSTNWSDCLAILSVNLCETKKIGQVVLRVIKQLQD